MAWSDNLITPLRVLINDLDSNAYTYTDAILKKVLVTSAKYVKQDVIGYSSTYQIDFTTPAISPDPSNDDVFCNFVVMRAACLANQWDVKAKALAAGVSAKLGPVSMTTDAQGSTVLLALLKDGFCAAYKEMLSQHNRGNLSEIGLIKSIMTPFTHSEYQPGQFPHRSFYN